MYKIESNYFPNKMLSTSNLNNNDNNNAEKHLQMTIKLGWQPRKK